MAIELPPSLARSPAAQELATRLERTQVAARESRTEARMAQSPMASFGWTQAGVVASAGLAAYAGDRYEPAAFVAALGTVMFGAYTRRPWLISVGNGIAAPLVFDRAYQMFTREPEATPAAAAA